MITSNCTASSAVSENITYPSLVTSRDHHHIAEDKKKYTPLPRLSSKAVKATLKQRLKQQRKLPIRIRILLDDLSLSPLLQEHKDVDVFDLLIELILIADHYPAEYLSALLAVLDDDAIFDLEPRTIKHCGEFISDVLKRDAVRWQLQAYHEEQQEEQKDKRKQRKQR